VEFDGFVREVEPAVAVAGRVVSTMRIEDRPGVDQMAASSDGNRLYVTAFGLYEFYVASVREVDRDDDTSIGALAVAADGSLAVGQLDGTISLRDPSDLSVAATLPGFRAPPSRLRYDASGRLLLAKGRDNTMALYDVGTRQRVADSIAVSDGDVDLRPDGREIAVGQEQPPGVSLWAIDPDTMAAAACVLAGRNLTRSEWNTYMGDLESYRATCPGRSLRSTPSGPTPESEVRERQALARVTGTEFDPVRRVRRRVSVVARSTERRPIARRRGRTACRNE